jgi:hypothetical protein
MAKSFDLSPIANVAGHKPAISPIGETLLRRSPDRAVSNNRLRDRRPMRHGRRSADLVLVTRGGIGGRNAREADRDGGGHQKGKTMHGGSRWFVVVHAGQSTSLYIGAPTP